MNLKSLYKALVRRKHIDQKNINKSKLARVLSTLDLTLLGVGSTLGLGIYVIAGQVASTKAGPAVVLSFFIAAVASVFAALCYAEFGARVPRAGSAYVYSYVTVGELMAFIIGWNLILEYVIGTASVARGYSGYLDSLIDGAMAKWFDKHMPIHIPHFSSYPDFMAFGITLLLTVMLAIGVKESTRFNNIFTAMNLLVVLYAVTTGSFKADIKNWELKPDEVPEGYGKGGFFAYDFSGMMAGAAMCFYAYVGFDCIATTGEEVRNPQRAIPISIISSLFIVFLAYCGVSTVETLMWPYYDQNQPAPLPYVFKCVGWPVARWIISIGALAGLSTSLIGAMFPLPRILYAMANDGLIFRSLANVHPTTKTPLLATILAGVFAGFMAMIFDVHELASMMSIGTLLAYTLVAVSVLILRYRVFDEKIPLASVLPSNSEVPSFQDSSIMEGSDHLDNHPLNSGKIKNDHIENKHEYKSMSISASISTMLSSTHHYTTEEILKLIFNWDNHEVQSTISSQISIYLIVVIGLLSFVLDAVLVLCEKKLFSLDILVLSIVGIIATLLIIVVFALAMQPSDQQQLSFRVPFVPVVPILSTIANIYLMMKLSVDTWVRFVVWMTIGFLIYFFYGIKNSSEKDHNSSLPPMFEKIAETEDEYEKNEASPLLSVD